MTPSTEKKIKTGVRLLLGAFLVTAGVGHLSFARKGFRAQVPNWVPLEKDDTVVYSGYAEIALGLALLYLGERPTASPSEVKSAIMTTAYDTRAADGSAVTNPFIQGAGHADQPASRSVRHHTALGQIRGS